jgi:hypothetical protein
MPIHWKDLPVKDPVTCTHRRDGLIKKVRSIKKKLQGLSTFFPQAFPCVCRSVEWPVGSR